VSTSAAILRFASGAGGFGRVAGRQAQPLDPGLRPSTSAGILRFASGAGGFGRVAGRQAQPLDPGLRP